MIEAIRKALNDMVHSPVRHYATAGLTSWLVGGDRGKVRLFRSDRSTRHWITPHSHRFNFTCLVLRGSVENIVFRKGFEGDAYCVSTLRPKAGGMGGYELERGSGWTKMVETSQKFATGETYSMRAEEIHSIRFSSDAEVLFFEGPEVLTSSQLLEPWSDGKVVPTFECAPWMFEREKAASTAEQP